MFRAAVDPALLFSPDIPDGDWVKRTSEWAKVAGHGCFAISCPKSLHEYALASWWEGRARLSSVLAQQDSPLAHQDLVLVVEELRGRLAPSAVSADSEALLTNVQLTPDYQPDAFDAARRGEFETHLGEVAYARRRTHDMAMVFTCAPSWNSDPSDIEVQAEVEMVMVADALEEVDQQEQGLREHLIGCCEPPEVFRALLMRAGELVPYPRLAVEAYARSPGVDLGELQFALGQGFVASLEQMHYAADHGRARTCWRTMALIAAGRTGELTGLDAHAVRRGKGPGADPITDGGGRTLMRGCLATSANAHRLHWWSGGTPEFVSVAGHDDPIAG
jgi:hypothetical protein